MQYEISGVQVTGDGPVQPLQEELRSLERRAQSVRRERGEAWTRNAAAQISGLSKQTVSGWFSQKKPRVPKNPDDLWRLVSTYSTWANERARRIFWNDLWEKANKAGDRTSPVLGRRISAWTDPFALEVHRSIDVEIGDHPLPLLPTYIRRLHDDQLDDLISLAIGGENTLVVLIGESSTGKTRACWEAVQKLPDSWNIWHPISPSPAEALLESLRKGIPPRTVLWLNETQLYIDTPGSTLGEQVAALLRELLRAQAAGPILALGTIWPSHWDKLTRHPDAQSIDTHPQARALLANRGITVPTNFSGESLARLEGAMNNDARLAEAYRANRNAAARITQFLAGAPAQMERYSNAPESSKAILDAAIDLRRFGHPPMISESVLIEMATATLDPSVLNNLDEDWFRQSIDYTLAPCRGVSGPLSRARRPRVASSRNEATYQLSDYIEHAGRATRAALFPPSDFPAIVLQNIHKAEQIRAIASSLADTGRLFFAAQLYLRAFWLGDYESGQSLVDILDYAKDSSGALEIVMSLCENGDPWGSEHYAYYLYRDGRVNEAEELCIHEFDKGNPKPWIRLREAYELDNNENGYKDLEGRLLSRKFPEIHSYLLDSKNREWRYRKAVDDLAARLKISQDEALELLDDEFTAIEPRIKLICSALEEQTKEIVAATARVKAILAEDGHTKGGLNEVKQARTRIAALQQERDFEGARKEILKGLNSGVIGIEILQDHYTRFAPSEGMESVDRLGVDWDGNPINSWDLATVRLACREALRPH